MRIAGDIRFPSRISLELFLSRRTDFLTTNFIFCVVFPTWTNTHPVRPEIKSHSIDKRHGVCIPITLLTQPCIGQQSGHDLVAQCSSRRLRSILDFRRFSMPDSTKGRSNSTTVDEVANKPMIDTVVEGVEGTDQPMEDEHPNVPAVLAFGVYPIILVVVLIGALLSLYLFR
jgi:hypothetical protein